MISKLKNAHIFEIRVAKKHQLYIYIYIELYSSLLEGICGIALQCNILLIGGGSNRSIGSTQTQSSDV